MCLALWTCAAAAGPPVNIRLCAAPSLVGMCCLVMPGAVDVCCSSRARGVCTRVSALDTHVHVRAPITCVVLSQPWCVLFSGDKRRGRVLGQPDPMCLHHPHACSAGSQTEGATVMQTRVACSHFVGGDTALVCFHGSGAVDVCCGSRTHCACTLCMRDQQDARQLATGDTHGRVLYSFPNANTGHVHAPILCMVLSQPWCVLFLGDRCRGRVLRQPGPICLHPLHACSARSRTEGATVMQTRVACSHLLGGADTALACFHVPGAVDVCCGSRTHCACTLCMRNQQSARQLATGDTHERVFYFFPGRKYRSVEYCIGWRICMCQCHCSG